MGAVRSSFGQSKLCNASLCLSSNLASCRVFCERERGVPIVPLAACWFVVVLGRMDSPARRHGLVCSLAPNFPGRGSCVGVAARESRPPLQCRPFVSAQLGSPLLDLLHPLLLLPPPAPRSSHHIAISPSPNDAGHSTRRAAHPGLCRNLVRTQSGLGDRHRQPRPPRPPLWGILGQQQRQRHFLFHQQALWLPTCPRQKCKG